MFASCFPSSNEDLPLDLSCKTIREEDGSPSTSKIESDVKIPMIKTIRNRERCLLPCQVCGKAFDRPSLLKRHIRTHTGEKPHVCDVCGKGFSTSSSLNTHRRIHSGEKPHQCPICGKRFTASSNLYYHRMTHVKEKPHKCTTCHKSFPTPGDLKSHMYVHNGSWPFHCHFCKRGFSKQTNLRNHLFLHTGKKPHSCSHCGKCFALACNLRAHMRTHSEPSELKNHQGKTASSNSDDANKDANGRNHHLVNNIEGLKGEEFLLRQQDEESLRAPSSDNDRLFHNHSQQFNHPASASVMLAHHQQVGVGSSPSSALVDHVFFWHTLQQQLATSILANSVRHHHHDQ